MSDDALITTAELGDRLRQPVATIRYWRHIGYGPSGVRVGRRVLYRVSDVERWLDDQFEATRARGA